MVYSGFLVSNVVVKGITHGETYDLVKGDLMITFNEGSATLNGIAYISGSVVNKTGEYKFVIRDSQGNSSVIDFTVIDTAPPIVSGVSDGTVYNSKSGPIVVTFNKGSASLNESSFTSGFSVSATGNYTLVVACSDNNTATTIHFSYIKYGDVNGDGLIDIFDLAKLKNHLLNKNCLSGVYLLAGNMYQTNKITISCLLAVKKYILGIQTTF